MSDTPQLLLAHHLKALKLPIRSPSYGNTTSRPANALPRASIMCVTLFA